MSNPLNDPACRPPYFSSVEGAGFYVLTRYADVSQVLADGTNFSTRSGGDLEADPRQFTLPSIHRLDGEPHAILRRRLKRSLDQALALTLPTIREVIATGLGSLRPRHEIDFVGDFACAVTGNFAIAWLGADNAAGESVGRLAHQLANTRDKSRSRSVERDFFHAILELRTRQKSLQLKSILLDALERNLMDDGSLGEHVIAANATVLVSALTKTLPAALSTLGILWTEHRPTFVPALDDARLLTASAEEVIRLSSPVAYMTRAVEADTDIGGVVLRTGTRAVLSFGSANLDETVFTDACSLDLGRPRRPHVSFGGGAHRCLGAREARIFVKESIVQMARTDLRLSLRGQPLHRVPGQFGGFESLPVTLHW